MDKDLYKEKYQNDDNKEPF